MTRHVTGPRAELRCRLAEGAVSGPQLWAEWVDALWFVLAGRAPAPEYATPTWCWRRIRRAVVAELALLGMTATVLRTDATVGLDRHDSRLGGHVVVHPASRAAGWDALPDGGQGSATALTYAGRMAQAHGLLPVAGLDRDLRRFCGQAAEHAPPGWVDHARTWVDRHGDVVLSVEPYGFDAHQVVRDLAGLPLQLDGPFPGVWNDGTTLMLLRHEPDAEVLAAMPSAEGDPDDVALQDLVGLVARMTAAEGIAMTALRRTLSPPGRSVERMLAAVLAAPDHHTALWWAARKLTLHAWAGHVTHQQVATWIGRTHQLLGENRPSRTGAVLAQAVDDARAELLGGATDEVLAVLGPDWAARVSRHLEHGTEVFRIPGLRTTLWWASGVATDGAPT